MIFEGLFLQVWGSFIRTDFSFVSLPEFRSFFSFVVEPFAQPGGAGDVFQPKVHGGFLFAVATGPETVYEDAEAVIGSGRA